MNFFRLIWLQAVVLFFFQTTKAQPSALPGFTVQTFGTANGLASSEIVSLYQDAKDFIWIGTRSGISRYDGYRFQNFEYAGNHRTGTVYSIAEDMQGILWIATETGLYYWDEKTFIHCMFKNEISWLPFTAIHFTAEGEAWLGTAKGLVHSSTLSKNINSDFDQNLLPDWRQTAVADVPVNFISSSKKGIAFGTYTSIYLYQQGQLTKIPYKAGERESLRGVCINDAGTVYWNNVLTGFYYWNGTETVRAAGDDAFYFDLLLHNGQLNIYTNAGIMQVDSATKKTKTVVNLWPLELRNPTCLMIDKEGSYWAGTGEGIFRIRKNEFTFYTNSQQPYTDDTYSLLRRRNGELLIGANRGKIFSATGSFAPYKKLPQAVPLAEIFSIYEDEEDALWTATGYQGITYFKAGKLKHFTTKNGLPDNTHNTFFKSSQGVLWTAGDWGLTRITKAAKDSFTFKPFFYNVQGGLHKLYSITEAPDGVIWGAGQSGIFCLYNDSLHLYSLPGFEGRQISATAIVKDKSGSVWISTRGDGILQSEFGSDHKVHLKKQWRSADGLPGNTFLSLVVDANGNLWAGNYTGVTALIKDGKDSFSIKNFDAADGFINKNYQSLRLFADGETIWACTTSGAVSFKPATVLQQKRGARIYITSVDLLNTKQAAEEFLIKSEESNPASYRFPSAINSLSIQFTALYFSNPAAITYYYQLQGIDSAWTSAGTERTILFRQLSPGKYTLLVKASIGGSDWTNTAKLLFQIKKPWWQQWWVIALAALAITLSAYAYIKNRERKLKRNEQQKTAFEKLKADSYQQQLEIEQVIYYFATSLNEHRTVDGVLWDVARNCISRLGFEDCVIYLKNDDGNKLVQRAAWGPKTTEENKIVNPIEIPLGKGIVGAVGLKGKAEKINDTSKDSRYIIDDAARASEITVPIYDGDKVIGVIDSENSMAGFYTERHLHILTTIASHCGAKISTLRAEASTASARMEALLNKQKALEASLQSMRLQMNPHFLFNALNSIQQMILSGDETTATRFLSKFSKLLRTVLTNSDREEISLKEEIELLQVYVELESLRFKESFHFSIKCDEAIDSEEVYIPALFFQPMVENAIWHGLMHKEGKRQLFIRFEVKSEGCLLCVIEDDGIGRKASQKTGNDGLHTGKGVSVALERLNVLNEKNGTTNSLTVIDCKDENGNATGTRIEIELYYQ